MKRTGTKMQKYRLEKEKNLLKIQELQARNTALERLILEAENTEIVAMVRSMKLSPEELATLIRGLREQREVPAFYEEQTKDELEDEEYEA